MFCLKQRQQLRYFQSLRQSLPLVQNLGGGSGILSVERRTFLSSCAKQVPNPGLVNLSLESLIRFQDEHMGHELVRHKAQEYVRKRPNYNNTRRRLLAKVIDRDKQLI